MSIMNFSISIIAFSTIKSKKFKSIIQNCVKDLELLIVTMWYYTLDILRYHLRMYLITVLIVNVRNIRPWM
jgi:hypothetical protein